LPGFVVCGPTRTGGSRIRPSTNGSRTLAAHRDTGVGSALLGAAVAHARDQGFVRLVLNPSERSIPFYRRAGFRASRLLQLDLET
jgi:GNAT superfamily N-acetyltransferase